MKRSSNRPILISLYSNLVRLFGSDYFDEADDEADNETNDNELADTTGIPDLESKESAEQRGQGLKILTTKQMLSRLPISFAQLQAEKRSEKLKNEIRQVLYFVSLKKIIQNNL